jgi:O-antigen/teichoic acid export membrane protein
MSIRVSRGDREGAIETFQSIVALLLLATASIGALIALLMFTIPLYGLFNIGAETAESVKVVLSAQVASVFLYQFTLLLFSGVRCIGRPATETAIAASSRLLEAAAIVVAALIGGDLVSAALAGLGARTVTLIALALWIRRTIPWLTLGLDHATFERLRWLFGPSISYMLVPISSAVLIQGPLVVLGAVSTPSNVALFSITRTVARLGMSGANMLNYAFTPEYSFAFGRKDSVGFFRILNIHAVLMIIGLIFYVACVLALGDMAVKYLSRNQLSPVAMLTIIMGLAVTLEMIWSGLFSPLSAVNAHKTPAVALSVLTFIVTIAVVPYASVVTLAVGLACVHFGMIAVTAWRVRRFEWFN